MSKVLLVDNETTRVSAIRKALDRGGFETVSATNGNEALRTFLNEVPDLVLVGPLAVSPDENFCERIRDTRPGQTLPIILYCETLSGDALKTALERSGCNVYVEMPASDERLIEVCRHALVESAEPAPEKAPTASLAADAGEGPAHASPDEAMTELEGSAKDIDEHLDSLFSTGEAPVAPVFSAEPAVSFEADMPEQPAQPAAEHVASMAETPPAPIAGEEAVDLGSDQDLIGFQPDTVAFEQNGEVAAGIQPEIASDAQSLIPNVPDPSLQDHFVVADPEFAGAGYAPTDVRPVQSDVDSADSLDFNVILPDEAPVAEMLESESTSRGWGWLWGLAAAAVVIGGIAVFFVMRPSSTGSAGSRNTTPLRSASAAPVEPLADSAPDALDDTLTPSGTEVGPDGTDTAVAEEPAVVDPVASVMEPVAEDTPPEVPTRPVADNAGGVANTADAEDSVAADAVNTDPEPAPVRPPTPPRPAAKAPKPAAPANLVFEPSTEIVDAATAGEGFTPPSPIDRAKPSYNPEDVPAGGVTLVLRVLVNDWGKPVRVDIEKAPTGSPLIDAAINAVLDTRYHPADLRGRQVRAWTTETFVFE